MFVLSQLPSPVGGGEKIRLVDDAFAKICQSINDPCVQVRVLAAELLGKIPQVSQTFLEQTLDKKLMSDMRVFHKHVHFVLLLVRNFVTEF